MSFDGGDGLFFTGEGKAFNLLVGVQVAGPASSGPASFATALYLSLDDHLDTAVDFKVSLVIISVIKHGTIHTRLSDTMYIILLQYDLHVIICIKLETMKMHSDLQDRQYICASV